jgi:tetratricopeptide (TPR) repeat protein
LTGSARVNVPATEAERTAAKLAERASRSAKRGDYQGAMRTLDEAERVAPQYALVYQYRSNVAFLMGDIEGAKAALRKALEIEPDNAFFQVNLRRLEETKGRGSPPSGE